MVGDQPALKVLSELLKENDKEISSQQKLYFKSGRLGN